MFRQSFYNLLFTSFIYLTMLDGNFFLINTEQIQSIHKSDGHEYGIQREVSVITTTSGTKQAVLETLPEILHLLGNPK